MKALYLPLELCGVNVSSGISFRVRIVSGKIGEGLWKLARIKLEHLEGHAVKVSGMYITKDSNDS
ncbi:hypothetical protein GN244_ATG08312 [Phytophthora infestans]|uniref:Uncharacterized protein n=1 Tax=Phytophthora infestans TaxID=4787 RepID=A0A833SD58_PHYIN|nr:hypothetical protein GN244_ATG08312 [Phytophthora infestans]KAF4141950.1 hypothetical protein GN958_ATG08839 [Phytophthora infestans]